MNDTALRKLGAMSRRTIVAALAALTWAATAPACSSGDDPDAGNQAGSGSQAASGGSQAAGSAGTGMETAGNGEWPNAGCTQGMDQTCNAEPTMNAIAGICSMAGTCLCKEGFAVDLASGKCAALMADPGAPCEHAGGCNDDEFSSMRAGVCLSDGTCYCLGKASKNPQSGLCKLP